MLINGFHSDRTKERFWHIVGPLCVTVIANVIAVSSLNTAARCMWVHLRCTLHELTAHARPRHDAHARLILRRLYCNSLVDYRFSSTTDSETSISDCTDQCRVQHSK